ncbi:MAG: TusE/DsrC/DsvC family sulfur relay protein [Chloroflexota bacterium]
MTVNLSLLETLDFDDDGFLADANAWNKEIGAAIASVLEIDLTEDHWKVIDFARKEYTENDDAPTLRRITRTLNITTKDLYAMFPGGAAKIAAKVAGLPKPTGCI